MERDQYPPELRGYEPLQPRGTDWRGLLQRIWAPIAVVLGLVLKFGFAVFKFFSIFISVAAYSLIWGWKFAVGFVVLILVHELGHFFEARRQGLEQADLVTRSRDAQRRPVGGHELAEDGSRFAAVPAAFQYGLWDHNAQDRRQRLRHHRALRARMREDVRIVVGRKERA